MLDKADPATGKYPKSVTTTWALNFEQVEQASNAAADLLRISAFLDADKIPFELISLGAAELSPSIFAVLAHIDDDPLALDEVLEPLTQYSLIRKDLGARTYDIHRLVQAVVRNGMDEATKRDWAGHAVRALACVLPPTPDVDVSGWPFYDRLLAHVLGNLCKSVNGQIWGTSTESHDLIG